nr:hypothetical protein [Sulfobacillus harzensis]
MVTAVKFPRASRLPAAIEEYAIRSGDFALAIAAAAVDSDAHGRVSVVRMVLGGVGDVPWRSLDLEESARGETAGPDLWTHLAEEAARQIDPADDLHATADYRRQLAQTLMIQALDRAHQKSVAQRGNS